MLITSTQHHHPHDKKIFNRYTLSLTQLFGLIHFTTWAVLVVLPLQQRLFNILLSHVCDTHRSLSFLQHFTCIIQTHKRWSEKMSIHFVICFEAENGDNNSLRKQISILTTKGETLGFVLGLRMEKWTPITQGLDSSLTGYTKRHDKCLFFFRAATVEECLQVASLHTSHREKWPMHGDNDYWGKVLQER